MRLYVKIFIVRYVSFDFLHYPCDFLISGSGLRLRSVPPPYARCRRPKLVLVRSQFMKHVIRIRYLICYSCAKLSAFCRYFSPSPPCPIHETLLFVFFAFKWRLVICDVTSDASQLFLFVLFALHPGTFLLRNRTLRPRRFPANRIYVKGIA